MWLSHRVAGAVSECPGDEELSDVLAGRRTLTAPLEEHLRTCPKCASRTRGGESTTFVRPAGGDVTTQVAQAFARPDARPAKDDTAPGTPRALAKGISERGVESPGPGSLVDRYRLLERLGEGGMGEVFSAWDPQLERRVAVKLVRLEGVEDPEAARERLLREAKALAQVNHPSVVSVYDAGRLGDIVFVAMELIAGQTLTQWASAKERSWEEIIGVMERAGRGLVAAHAAGLVHRDFKPSNVMVAADGRVVVLDFGLAFPGAAAKGTGSGANLRGVTQVGAVVGTAGYMAPEQIEAQPLDSRTDEFAFAVVCWELLYGARPFLARTHLAFLEEVQTVVLKQPPLTKVPPTVHAALVRALSSAPAARFPSLEALLDALGGDTSTARTMVAVPSTLLIAAGVLGALVTLVGAVGTLLTGGSATELPPMDPGTPEFARRVAELIAKIGWGLPAISFVVNCFTVWGAWEMKRLSRWWAAVTAACLGIIPCMFNNVCCIFAMPVGVWCLIVLLRPEVRSAFRATMRRA